MGPIDFYFSNLLVRALNYFIYRMISSSPSSNVSSFVLVFGITTFGSFLCTINGILLGAKISLLQTISVLGYCIFPIVLMSISLTIVGWFMSISRLLKLLFAIGAFSWSSLSANAFISKFMTSKRFLGAFPLMLYFGVLSMFLVSL